MNSVNRWNESLIPDSGNPGLAYAEVRKGGNGAHDKTGAQRSRYYLVL